MCARCMSRTVWVLTSTCWCRAVNRYAQSSDVLRKMNKGQPPDTQEMLLHDTCQAALLDPAMAGDAIQFMSLQVRPA